LQRLALDPGADSSGNVFGGHPDEGKAACFSNVVEWDGDLYVFTQGQEFP